MINGHSTEREPTAIITADKYNHALSIPSPNNGFQSIINCPGHPIKRYSIYQVD
jgi:hypothetical protein